MADLTQPGCMSIRLKHGKNTIMLFIDSAEPLTQVQRDLLEILQERYPDGIMASVGFSQTKLPKNASQIKLAVPKHKSDPTKGWKRLDADRTPQEQGFHANIIVAFAFAEDDLEDADVEFEVDFPSYNDEDPNAGVLH